MVVATFWVSILGLILGGITLYVVIRQLAVMRRQATLETRQLEIIEKQDQLLALRSELSVESQVKEAGGGAVRIDFNAYNAGEKSASSYY